MNTHPTSIYLAGPIDGISTEESCGWREELARIVPSGVLLVSPAHAYIGTVNSATAKAMDHLNRVLLQSCPGFVANLLGPGRGFGTIREIEFAILSQRFVAVACHDDLRESLMTYDILMFDSIMEAVTSVMERITEKRNTPEFMGLPGFLFPQQRPDEDGRDD